MNKRWIIYAFIAIGFDAQLKGENLDDTPAGFCEQFGVPSIIKIPADKQAAFILRVGKLESSGKGVMITYIEDKKTLVFIRKGRAQKNVKIKYANLAKPLVASVEKLIDTIDTSPVKIMEATAAFHAKDASIWLFEYRGANGSLISQVTSEGLGDMGRDHKKLKLFFAKLIDQMNLIPGGKE